ncbi:hypothetical protein K466DRAFT_601531 [Polyporus arcularius HHB13444]|uniref:F-box domain-containing protein n=1 Tax=Polyporus arcularius HHB13444 TaxID=1314778 RepID=A0A5C3P5T2_9APHY|nr:hypothetical protein K466DRAFT_601531 [Polyporus arcularius HHB13444]
MATHQLTPVIPVCFNEMLDVVCHPAVGPSPALETLVETLNQMALDLPPELYTRIADNLPTPDKCRLAVVSVQVHDAVIISMYRDLFLVDQGMIRLLRGLLSYTRRGDGGCRRNPAVYEVRTVTYATTDAQLDAVALPLLCSLIEHAVKLRYIAIDFSTESLPVARKLFRHSGLRRNEPSPLLSRWHPHNNQYNQCKLSVPALECVRSSHLEVLEDLCKFRALKSIIVEDGTSELETNYNFIKTFRGYSGRNGLQTFAYSTSVEQEPTLLSVIAYVFPNLRHISVSLHKRDVINRLTLYLLL